ncbi:MAG: RNA polymerase sigma factor [Bacteroidales bacterium]
MKVNLYKEEDIVKGCQKGDRRYQEILYRMYAPKMYGICISYAGERPLAQDMLQEAFVKIFKSIRNFKADGSLEGWVRRIVVNTALDLIRSKGRIHKLIQEETANVSTTSFSENNALPSMQMSDMLRFIAKLPDGARAVFNLFAVEGYSHKEIAEQLHISVGTSKSQFNRARNLLQNWIGELK